MNSNHLFIPRRSTRRASSLNLTVRRTAVAGSPIDLLEKHYTADMCLFTGSTSYADVYSARVTSGEVGLWSLVCRHSSSDERHIYPCTGVGQGVQSSARRPAQRKDRHGKCSVLLCLLSKTPLICIFLDHENYA